MNMVLPLVVAVTIAHGFTVLGLKRSILTEKISRRGNHLGREYAVDPLELLFVKDAMTLDFVTVPSGASVGEARSTVREKATRRQRLYPVVDEGHQLVGLLTRSDLEEAPDGEAPALDLVKRSPVIAYTDETLRVVAYRMAQTGLTRLPVVDRQSPHTVMGIISLRDLLKARSRTLENERRRERVLRMDAVLPVLVRRRSSEAPAASV
jgi:CBS domain-containing protein